CEAPPAGAVAKFAHTSQSPGVSRRLVISAVTPLVSATPVAELKIYSPTAPGGEFDALGMPGIDPSTPTKSAGCKDRKDGCVFPPEAGPAKMEFGACATKLAPETIIPL